MVERSRRSSVTVSTIIPRKEIDVGVRKSGLGVRRKITGRGRLTGAVTRRRHKVSVPFPFIPPSGTFSLVLRQWTLGFEIRRPVLRLQHFVCLWSWTDGSSVGGRDFWGPPEIFPWQDGTTKWLLLHYQVRQFRRIGRFEDLDDDGCSLVWVVVFGPVTLHLGPSGAVSTVSSYLCRGTLSRRREA